MVQSHWRLVQRSIDTIRPWIFILVIGGPSGEECMYGDQKRITNTYIHGYVSFRGGDDTGLVNKYVLVYHGALVSEFCHEDWLHFRPQGQLLTYGR